MGTWATYRETNVLLIGLPISEGLRQRQYFNWLAVFIGAGFIGSELALFTICRPLNQYWAVPTSDRMSTPTISLCSQICETPISCGYPANPTQHNVLIIKNTKSFKHRSTSPATSLCFSSPSLSSSTFEHPCEQESCSSSSSAWAASSLSPPP